MRSVGVFLLLLNMSVVFSLQGNAQVQFALGPKVGMNFASASVEPTIPGISGRTTVMFGSAFELLFGGMFGVQLEPAYITKGASADNLAIQTQEGPVAANLKLSYKEIQIPILFKAKFLTGQVKPFAFVGPNLGIVSSATITVSPAQGSQFTEQDVDIKSATSGTDFGLDFGSGVEFKVARNIGLTADLRYSLGLSNLDKEQQPGQQASTTKTRGFQIQFGALFGL